jgi:hypothetical protein
LRSEAESPAGSTREEPHAGDNMPLNRMRTWLETRPVRGSELASFERFADTLSTVA